MTPDEILKGLYDETMVGNKPAVLELTQEGIDSGLPPERMLFEDRSRNTSENARLGHALAAPGPGERWALVTSAFHMPRALRSFAAAGWEGVVPVPADFRSRAWADGMGWNFHRNLGLLNTALREAVGRLAYAATGR